MGTIKEKDVERRKRESKRKEKEGGEGRRDICLGSAKKETKLGEERQRRKC